MTPGPLEVTRIGDADEQRIHHHRNSDRHNNRGSLVSDHDLSGRHVYRSNRSAWRDDGSRVDVLASTAHRDRAGGSDGSRHRSCPKYADYPRIERCPFNKRSAGGSRSRPRHESYLNHLLADWRRIWRGEFHNDSVARACRGHHLRFAFRPSEALAAAAAIHRDGGCAHLCHFARSFL